MTLKPGEQDGSGNPAGARRTSALERDSAAQSEPRATSPLRVLLVIVPLLILIGAGAYLVTTLLVDSQQPAAPKISRPESPAKDAERRPTGGGIANQEQPAERPFDVSLAVALVARASPENGATLFKMCAACHTSEKGGPNKVGSNLWDIVGLPIAARPGFNFSAALKAKRGVWSYRALAEYLSDPRKFAPGTSMAFFGIRDEKRVADLIAYMLTLSDIPPPLPLPK